MKASKQLRNKLFYEYAFCELVDEFNQGNSDNVIRCSEARGLRARVVEALGGEGVKWDEVTLPVWAGAVNGVLSERFGREPYGSVDEVKLQAQRYRDITGWGKNVPDVTDPSKYSTISPYDPDFASRASILKAGSQLRFVRADEVEDLADLADPRKSRNVELYERRFDRHGDVSYRPTGEPLSRAADIVGLSKLAPYMEPAEFDRMLTEQGLFAWALDSRVTTEDLARVRDAMDGAVSALKYLRDNGYHYSIETVYTGAASGPYVRASIRGTGIKVRLSATPDAVGYIGDVYADGVRYRIQSSLNQKSTAEEISRSTFGPEVALKPLQMALGEEVRPEGYGDTVGISNWNAKARRSVRTETNTAYHLSKSMRVSIGALPGNDFGQQLQVFANTANLSASVQSFPGPEEAEAWLRTAITSARDNIRGQVDVEALVRAVESGEDFETSANDDVRTLQEMYLDVLEGREDRLLVPGHDADEFQALAGEADASLITGDVEAEGSVAYALFEGRLAEISLSAKDFSSREEMVREHLGRYLDERVGSFDADARGERFDPDEVALSMDTAFGIFRNRDNIVSACVAAGVEPGELKGTSPFASILADRCIEFDEESAEDLSAWVVEGSDFVPSVEAAIRGALRANGIDCTGVRMDEKGVIQYTGLRHDAAEKGAKDTPVTGQLGQVFVPDATGSFTTAFQSSDDYVFVPGYDAHILDQVPGEGKSVEERTRLIGYTQAMCRAIRYQIHRDTLHAGSTELGTAASLNGVYRRIPGERYDMDWWHKARLQQMDTGLVDDIMRTQAGRVRYDNSVRDGSTINAVSRAERFGFDMANDNFGDAFSLTGGRNMAIIGEEREGYFDPMMTTSDTNQGTTVYLVEGASVNPDGSIERSADLKDRAPLAKREEFATMAFDPFNRQQMTYSNAMHSVSTAKARVAQMAFGGWNMEDAIVVSKEFAQAHRIMGTSGELRDLMPGDKLSDLHGNKGVISLVVDREMSEAKANEFGIADQVAWFKANPELDCVMAPFSAVSRFNGGTAREMIGTGRDLVSPDGDVHPGCIGECTMLVTDKTADASTHAYTDEDVSAGKGRKVSSQLIWALDAAGCDEVLGEVFGPTASKVATVREVMVSIGLDVSETGQILPGYKEQPGEGRRVFPMRELEYDSKGRIMSTSMMRKFAETLDAEGGFLPVPFKIRPRVGEAFPTDEAGNTLLPVLSSSLRSSQELSDGSTITHDYTNQYRHIYGEVIKWRDNQRKLGQAADATEASRIEAAMAACESRVQSTMNGIASDLVNKKVVGKHNMFKDVLMSRRMRRSATSIVTPDPTLPVDTLKVGRAMAEVLGIEGDAGELLVWRDPVLREGGVRYVDVEVSDDICGIAINPVSFQCMDGDFDGDKLGCVNLSGEEARRQAREKLSFAANMLEPSYVAEDGLHDLAFNTGLDVKAGAIWDEGDALAEVRERANRGEATCDDVTCAIAGALENSCGTCIISYESVEANIDSIRAACIDTGAKGSPSKLRDYATYLGVHIPADAMDAAGHIDWSKARDAGHTLATRQNHEDTEMATAIKSFGTGIAGKYSQRGIKALRDMCPRAVLECTKPVTQAVLQAKHDPLAAMNTYQMLQGPIRDLWRGREVKFDSEAGTWRTSWDDDGPVQSNREAWVESFCTIYTSPTGLNEKVNRAFVEEISQAMVGSDGKMMSIEDMGVDGSYSSFLDEMAYDGTVASLQKGAAEGRNLYEGECAKWIRPDKVTVNVMREQSVAGLESHEVEALSQAGLVDDVQPLVKGDVRAPKPVVDEREGLKEPPASADGKEPQAGKVPGE